MADILDTQFEGHDIELRGTLVALGDDVNLIAKDPTLKKVLIAAGWDVNAFNVDALDLDLSLFLLNGKGQTRQDEDFIFYNQASILDGAVKHNGDSRTGAGDGDDESAFVDLNALPLDIMQIAIVLSVYKGYEKEQNISMIRNAYVRILNAKDDKEIVRFKIDELLEDREDTGLLVAFLNREGPKWHFKPVGEPIEKGLSEIAQRYGLIIGQE